MIDHNLFESKVCKIKLAFFEVDVRFPIGAIYAKKT